MTFNITGRFIYYGYATGSNQFVDSTNGSSIPGLEFRKILILRAFLRKLRSILAS